jgi:hypothetical protein
MIAINEDVFYEEYKPQINHIVREQVSKEYADEDICSFGGIMYETYGGELEYIKSLLNEGKHKNIWTILDCEGELVISAGCRFVNRIGYVVTEKEWEDESCFVEEI